MSAAPPTPVLSRNCCWRVPDMLPSCFVMPLCLGFQAKPANSKKTDATKAKRTTSMFCTFCQSIHLSAMVCTYSRRA